MRLTRWKKGAALGAIVCSALVLTSVDAHATLTVTAPNGTTRTIDANGDISPPPGTGAGDHPFFQQVQDCLTELDNLGKLGVVQSLVASGNAHSITMETNACRSSVCAADDDNAFRAADGTPGSGTGSTTTWQPTNTKAFTDGAYADGTPRDPCAALLHELVHADDADKGHWSCDLMDTNEAGTQSVLVDEVRACQMQNWMHQAKGMASRTQYGGEDLPPGVIFDKCPNCVTLDVVGGGLTAIDLYFEVPVTGTGKATNSEVPGREIPVGASGIVTLVKNLDGTVTVCLECAPTVGSDTLTSIHWSLDGQPLTPMPDDFDGTPLSCDIAVPKDTSTPRDMPDVPSLRVNKFPDHQTVDENGEITFTIKVTNTGTQPLMNVMVGDNLFPSENYTIPNLAPGETDCREITVNVGTGTGDMVNIALAQGQTAGGINVQSQDFAPFTVNAP